MIVFVLVLIILTVLSIFCVRWCIHKGLVLFKKNIRLIVLCSVAVCFAVVLRFELLWSIDMFYHHRISGSRTHFISNIFTMFDYYRSLLPHCLHRELVAASYLTQLALAGMLIFAKFLVITKSILILNNRNDSFKYVYEMTRTEAEQNKKTVLKLCLIEILPFYLSRLIRAVLIVYVFFNPLPGILGFLVEIAIENTMFVAYAIALMTTTLSSYMICHAIYREDDVIKNSLFVIKQALGKLIAFFVAFYGVYGLSYYILRRLSFLIFSIIGLWTMLPIRVIWGIFDMFTVASLLLLSTIIVTFFIHAFEFAGVAEAHEKVS